MLGFAVQSRERIFCDQDSLVLSSLVSFFMLRGLLAGERWRLSEALISGRLSIFLQVCVCFSRLGMSFKLHVHVCGGWKLFYSARGFLRLCATCSLDWQWLMELVLEWCFLEFFWLAFDRFILWRSCIFILLVFQA